MVHLSIIIVNYNVKVFLEQALHSIGKALEGISSEIFVVDNASRDGSVALIKRKFPNVKLIENRKNVGFARANNQALKEAKGEIICLINPDTLVSEDTFRICLDYLQNHPDTGVVGCKILNPDGTLQLACRRSFPTPWVAFSKVVGLNNLFPKSKLFGKYNLTYLDPEETTEVDAISGSFMMIQKKAVDEVGLLDETFFLYGEDLDWCYRMRQAGWKIVYLPKTQIIHYKGQSAKEATFNHLRVFYSAMSLFVNKHFNRGWYLLPRWFLILGIWLRGGLSFINRLCRKLVFPAVDVLFLQAGLLLALLIRFGHLHHFGSYRIINVVYSLIWLACLFIFGLYERTLYSTSKALGATVTGLILNTSVTFFFPQYAYSRKVVLIAGSLNILFLVGWRLFIHLSARLGRLPVLGALGRNLGKRRTLIVGTDSTGSELYKRIRARVDSGYEVVGFLGISKADLLAVIDPQVPVLGIIDDMESVVKTHRIQEVVFSPGAASYERILDAVVTNKNLLVDFKMVPRELDVVIGRTSIDNIDDIPLVDLDYRIFSTPNMLFKRMLDLLISLPVLIFHLPVFFVLLIHPCYHFKKFRILDGKGSPMTVTRIERKGTPVTGWLNILPLFLTVLTGKMSLAGTEIVPWQEKLKQKHGPGFKPGLTGLVQVNAHKGLTVEEKERYGLYYLKGYSPLLDIEILFKAVFHL